MNVRFVTKNIHALLDYPVAIALIGLPFVLNLGAIQLAAFWLSVVTGVAAFVLTLLTNHQLGVLRVLPYGFHLAVDALVGVTFLTAPLALGFTGIDFWYYLANGAAVMFVVSMHKPESSNAAQTGTVHRQVSAVQ